MSSSLRRLRIIILASLIALPFAHATDPTPEQLAAHRAKVRKANAALTGSVAYQLRGLKAHLGQRGLPGGPGWDFDLHTPHRSIRATVTQPSLEEMLRDESTYDLYSSSHAHQGEHQHRGAFLDSSSPDKWNLQRWVGWLVPELRHQLLDNAKTDGIHNIRFGVNMGDINTNRPETVEPVLEALNDMWERGIYPTLSILFFPSLDKWAVLDDQHRVDAMKSYLLNPDFPKEAGQRAQFVLHHVKKAADKFNAENAQRPPGERRPEARVDYNPVNEAETFVAFQNFWQGGLHKWSSPDWMAFYVPASINLGLAGIEIQNAIYNVYGSQRVVIIQNPAITDRNYPSHQGDLQFFVIKLLLGSDELLKADLDQLRREPIADLKARVDQQRSRGQINSVEAAIVKFIDCPSNSSNASEARDHIITEFQKLRDKHVDYQQRTGRTAATDTVLMFDYYQQSEFLLPKPVPELIQELAKDHGAKLKAGLEIGTDEGFFNVLRERAHEAEKFTNQKLWHDYKSVADIDFVSFLSQEDGIVLDKLVGLRNEWNIDHAPELNDRRQRAGWNFDEFRVYRPGEHPVNSDELRDDRFLNRILENDAAVLKHALGVGNDAELRAALRQIGRDDRGTTIDVSDHEPLRDILNKNQRAILHRTFGFRRKRLTGFLPPHMAIQIRLGMREGFANTAIRYMNELRIRVIGIAEWGTPWPWVELTDRQLSAELAMIGHKANAFITRRDGGSLVAPIGWMGGPVTGTLVTNGDRAADGIYKIVRVAPKKYVYVLNDFMGGTPHFVQYRDRHINEIRTYHEKVAEKERRKASRMNDQKPAEHGSHQAPSCSMLFR